LIIVSIFLVIDFVGYRILYSNHITSHEKDVQILFYKIRGQTGDLLSKLLYEFSSQKDILRQKHKEVLQYIHENPYDTNLSAIQQYFNKGLSYQAYNIYVTNKKYVIVNSTYAPDIGFDLTFAKQTFDKNRDNGVIGCSSPLFEKSAKSFLSYTDSYFYNQNGEAQGIVQVSYTYAHTRKSLKNLSAIIDARKDIKEAKAYIVTNTGFINDVILKDFPAYKPQIAEIIKSAKEGEAVSLKLKNNTLVINKFEKEAIPYRELYMSTQSPLFEDTGIMYSILLDESDFYSSLNNLNIFMFMITVLGLVGIVIITKVRNKEVRLNEQDAFVQSAMHEIKTPLSIITLNNELREITLGEDEYSREIDGALKVLKNSYDDMSFVLTNNMLSHTLEEIDLSEVLTLRVKYFESIANVNLKSIHLDTKSDCQVQISMTELIRLIDNNLSNAIKYSDLESTISVTLHNNLLSFKNSGQEIKDTNKVFEKYFRENAVVGGYGLGLNIVQTIAAKYNIEIQLDSDEKRGTVFSYFFKCHSDDIS